MILTVTPNTTIDKTYTVPNFTFDKVHRPIKTESFPGGKGIALSRILKVLETPTTATGFIAGSTGSAIISGLEKENIPHDFVEVDGESRLCLAIIDPTTETQTEINEKGPNISLQDCEKIYKKIEMLLKNAKFMTLCGSVPTGTPDDFYYNLIRLAKSMGVKTALDTSGTQLIKAMEASPFIVKPNIVELSQIIKKEHFTIEEIFSSAKALKNKYNIEIVTVTMGRKGALVTDGKASYLAIPPKIDFVSAVGSGDSFLAAFLASHQKNKSLKECLRWATAAGAANASTAGAGLCTKNMIYSFIDGIKITMLVD